MSTRVSSSCEFQSTLPVWGATLIAIVDAPYTQFQSTLPVWGATCGQRTQPRRRDDFNPRSPCGERLTEPALKLLAVVISIHAPRVGSDLAVDTGVRVSLISIHAPRVGSDTALTSPVSVLSVFQSTLPVWGATHGPADDGALGIISIHAPRVGSDSARHSTMPVPSAFQSTLPVWGAT